LPDQVSIAVRRRFRRVCSLVAAAAPDARDASEAHPPPVEAVRANEQLA
jgi:hypothetical protein